MGGWLAVLHMLCAREASEALEEQAAGKPQAAGAGEQLPPVNVLAPHTLPRWDTTAAGAGRWLPPTHSNTEYYATHLAAVRHISPRPLGACAFKRGCVPVHFLGGRPLRQ